MKKYVLGVFLGLLIIGGAFSFFRYERMAQTIVRELSSRLSKSGYTITSLPQGQSTEDFPFWWGDPNATTSLNAVWIPSKDTSSVSFVMTTNAAVSRSEVGLKITPKEYLQKITDEPSIKKPLAFVTDYLVRKGFVSETEQSNIPESRVIPFGDYDSAWFAQKSLLRCRFTITDPNAGVGEEPPYTYIGTFMCVDDAIYLTAKQKQFAFASIIDAPLRSDILTDKKLVEELNKNSKEVEPFVGHDYFMIAEGAPHECDFNSNLYIMNIGQPLTSGGLSYMLLSRNGNWNITHAQCPHDQTPNEQSYNNAKSIGGEERPLKYENLEQAVQAFRDATDSSMIIDAVQTFVPGVTSERSGYPYTSYLLGHYMLNSIENECVHGYMNLVTGESKTKISSCWTF